MKRQLLLPLLVAVSIAFTIGTADAQAGLFGRRVARQNASSAPSRQEATTRARLASGPDVRQRTRLPGRYRSSPYPRAGTWSMVPRDVSDYGNGNWPPFD